MERITYDALGETMYRQVLPNGLAVYVFPKGEFQKKYAFFATSYGGADRRFMMDGQWRDTPAGIAHFLEHKMFDTEDGNALADLAANGASPNAFTSAEMTAYHFECTDNFEDNLKTLLSFVSVPYFTQESVDKEQGIIGQEIGMVEDNPGHAVYYNLLKCLYGTHPVRDMIVGTVESIAQITAETLYSCHSVFYRPSNMALCVVGDVDPEAVVNIAEQVLPRSSGEPPVKDYGPEDAAPVIRERTEAEMEVSMPLFLIGTKVRPGVRGEAYLRQEMAGNLATRYLAGKSSPLYLKLYSEGVITGDFSCGFSGGLGHALTEFGGESRSPDKVLEALRDEIRRTLESGLDNDRFVRLKRAFSGQLIRGLDSFEDLCYEQTEGHFHGANVLDRIAILDTVEAGDVLAFIGKNLRPEQFALSVVRPKS